MTEEKTDLETLQQLTSALSAPDTAITSVKITDPLAAAEKTFAEFAQHSFKCVEGSLAFEAAVQDALMSRLAEADFKQLMNLYGMVQSGNTFRTEKLVMPFASIAVSERSIEAAQHEISKPQDTVYQNASKDVLQGIVQLSMVLEKLADVNNKVPKLKIVEDDGNK